MLMNRKDRATSLLSERVAELSNRVSSVAAFWHLGPKLQGADKKLPQNCTVYDHELTFCGTSGTGPLNSCGIFPRTGHRRLWPELCKRIAQSSSYPEN
jgi:hypothetical protein